MSSQIKHYLENIIIDYIKINSDSLISSFYNNYISIINVEISNIFCFGDNSSVLSLDTGIMDSIINIENLKIYSCVSNGPIIRFNGNFNNIFIKNSTLYDNTSYGSTIENISKKVLFYNYYYYNIKPYIILISYYLFIYNYYCYYNYYNYNNYYYYYYYNYYYKIIFNIPFIH